jgi:hypothetical protein
VRRGPPVSPHFSLLALRKCPITTGRRLLQRHSAPFAPRAAPPSSSTPSSGYKGRALALLHLSMESRLLQNKYMQNLCGP